MQNRWYGRVGAPTDLRLDSFKLSLVFGRHPLVEGMKRLGGE